MSSQFSLLKKRRFLPMFLTQFLGAFNDNVFKQALLLLLTYYAAQQMGLAISLLNNLAALLFILPFFLFSSTAGQIADKYEKSMLIRRLKLIEIAVMSLATVGFLLQWYGLLLLALFLMGAHSSLFGPVKYAYLPQALQPDELVGGNALFQSGTSVSILTGTMLGGVLVASSTLEMTLIWTCVTVLSIAILGWLASRGIPQLPAATPDLNIDWNIFRTSASTLREAWALRGVFYAIIGISWFWYYGATFLTQIPEFTTKLLVADPSVVTFLLTLFTVGVATGSLLCKTLLRNQISLKLLPIGVVGLSVFALDLYFSLNQLPVVSNMQSLNQILDNPVYWRVFVDLLGLGMFGGFYIVPLYAVMQAYAPEARRARIIAANNILNAFFMVVSAIIAIVLLSVLALSLPMLFVYTAALNLLIGGFVIVKTRQHLPKSPLNTGLS
ncbi:MAG: MFS transporter [Pseudomonadota bacterium]|nr:MFS transporter [Pseudomonadota bacterium]